MNLLGKVCGLLCAIAQTHGCKHVALGCYAYTCTAAHAALAVNLLPESLLGTLYLLAFRVAVNFLHYGLNLLKFKVNDVVHYALCLCRVLLEQLIVEIGLGSEWVYNV